MLKQNKLSKAIKTGLVTCAMSSVAISSAIAQEIQTPDEAAAAYEKVVITGSRGAPRSLADSPVPVDVLSEDDLAAVPFSDTNDILKTLVPSYSLQRQPISDGASFIRPATLRGMPTDKTLVLVNSKRRHRSALVQIGGSGTQGPDIATIPSSALKGVEVLRDGAAAQYGSDAIAGVINFVLKDNDEGGSFSVDAGQYYEGDGEQVTLTGNIGFALGDNGFFSLSAEYADSDSTNRGEQYCEDWFCADASDPRGAANPYLSDPDFVAGLENANLGGEDVVQPWGQPNTSATRIFFNSGYEFNDDMKFYAFGNYSESEGDASFYYRYPGNGTIEDLRQEDGSIYSPLEKFPGGFTPRFFGDITDFSLVGGLEGEFANGMTYDFSGRFGSNEIEYTLKNTINPSMGADSPTEFHPGDLINEELQFSADFTKYFDFGLYSDVLFAFGLTYMEETYELKGGDEASYSAGAYATSDPWGFCDDAGGTTAAGLAVIAGGSTLDCSNSDDPVYQVVGVGSNGFPGYSPEYSGEYERDMHGIYADLSSDVSEDLFLQAAMRYEDYSDFGSELVGKLAFKYTISDDFNMRGSVGTGFRAPTPGQQGTTNVSTRLPEGLPVATGLFPALSAVGQALGAEALKPEKSLNYSLGVTGNIDDLNVTLDFYRIELEDRFYAVSTLDVSTDETDADAYANFLKLEAAGVAGANTIGGVNYFQNAFDTVTNGMDFVVTYTMGDTVLSTSVNYNKTEIDSDASAFLNAEDQFDLENAIPEWRGVASAKHSFDDLTLLVRANIYGSYENAISSDATTRQEYDPTVFFDLEATYQISENVSIAAGARNIFDEYPDKDNGDECCGAVYWSSNIVDWQGGYYYMRLNTVF
ncbi:TonB-dependent receptor [Paraglaciecola chathamensis]|uniref:TonB-dependent receptor plug domain-containing protein n=1 Tax=Paraglaciecola chathamensis TaxID=368405 RepID=UPI002704AF1B|nr:TonB-dependent receptor [Paraglaciecola chathamensis]MDO6838293.1 TonB-dependent receptor [Paraglaciecola chathamensis]